MLMRLYKGVQKTEGEEGASEKQARRIGPTISRRENTRRRREWKMRVAPNYLPLCESQQPSICSVDCHAPKT
jgi:hypothetical protein